MKDLRLPHDVVIDALRGSDADRCAALERQLFPGDDPWTAAAFRQELRAGHTYLAARRLAGAREDTARRFAGAREDTARRFAGAREDTAGRDELLVGYGGIAVVGGPPQAEAEIHTIGVDPAHQGLGIGRALLRGLLAAVAPLRAAVFLEVRTDNGAARALYESEGFAAVGLRRRYYASGADAHTMRRDPR